MLKWSLKIRVWVRKQCTVHSQSFLRHTFVYIYIIQTNCDVRCFLSFSWIHESNIFGNTPNLVDCFAAHAFLVALFSWMAMVKRLSRFRLKVNWLFQRFPGTVQVEYSNYAWSRETSFFFTVALESFNGSLPICLMLVYYSCFHQIPFTIRLEHHTIRFC